MRPMTQDLRSKIQMYIKNNIDISDLIDGVSIKGENLSGAIIKKLSRPGDDISGCNLSRAIIGDEGGTVDLNSCIARECSFKETRFNCKLEFRKVDARGSNFSGAFLAWMSYEYTDFRHCRFCDIVMCIGSIPMKGTKFDSHFFKEIGSALGLIITTAPQEPELAVQSKEEENVIVT